jgi:hypothetical protein
MRVINEKGKIFGLINIIDFTVIIFIVLVGCIFLFKSFVKVSPVENENLTVTFRGAIRNADQAKVLKENDQLISVLNPADAYIKSVKVNDLQVPISTADGKQVYAIDPIKKELVVEFTMKAASGKGIVKLDSQDVCVGSKNFILKTRKFELQGTIEAIQPD